MREAERLEHLHCFAAQVMAALITSSTEPATM
jgi:hypothetical protein